MKKSFYFALARDSIRKNKRLYLPFLLTAAGMTAIFYILHSLLYSPLLTAGPGKRTLTSLFSFGCIVLALFSAVFLFYTHSTLIRRRKNEFGLYSVLGMDKRAIGRVTVAETLLEALYAIVPGLAVGILFSKLAEMIVGRILNLPVAFTMVVPPEAVAFTVEIYGVIFLVLLLRTFAEVRFASPILLLQSESVGEKPPRSNLLLALAGMGLLMGAYAIAVTIRSPLSSIPYFFIAVLMVIVGTYLIFISGSVYFLRLMQKNRAYYYHPRRFVSISSMVYRMKRNGAGLASICILCTMVLVIVISTGSLIIGAEDGLRQRYPRDISVSASSFLSDPEKTYAPFEQIKSKTAALVQKHGVTMKSPAAYRFVSFFGYLENGAAIAEPTVFNILSPKTLDRAYQFCILPREDYNAFSEEPLPSAQNEAYVYISRAGRKVDRIALPGMESMALRQLPSFPVSGSAAALIMPTMYLVVDNFDKVSAQLARLQDSGAASELFARMYWELSFDTDAPLKTQLAMRSEWFDVVPDLLSEQLKGCAFSFEAKQAERDEYYAMNGGLFFLGIMLSLVFLAGTVLLIYFKQLSEGYEDEKRFAIMRRVGMTREDIRKSINSQVLTVFFIPLVFAALHLAFAFPMIRSLLILFGLGNTALFLSVTCIAFVVFAVFYAVIYRLTSNAYFDVVTTCGEEK